MTTIAPGSQLLSLLRTRMASARGVRGAARPRPTAATVDAAAAGVAERIRAIAPDDPQRRRKAVRIYLESELADEFGARLLTDPAFAQMLDAVQAQMEADAQVAQAVHALGDLLLAGKAR